MQTLTAQQLKNRMQQDPNLLVINTLDSGDFEVAHIPGTINIPRSGDHFEQEVKNQAGNKAREIVVYCASASCDSSSKAAKALEEAGFQNVYDFEGGTKGWKEAGFELKRQESVGASQ